MGKSEAGSLLEGKGRLGAPAAAGEGTGPCCPEVAPTLWPCPQGGHCRHFPSLLGLDPSSFVSSLGAHPSLFFVPHTWASDMQDGPEPVQGHLGKQSRVKILPRALQGAWGGSTLCLPLTPGYRPAVGSQRTLKHV